MKMFMTSLLADISNWQWSLSFRMQCQVCFCLKPFTLVLVLVPKVEEILVFEPCKILKVLI